MRWAAVEELSPELAEHAAGFTGPFLSQATYRDGQLDGVWRLFDADSRLVSEVRFRNGRRDGAATLWTPTGGVRRRAQFAEGTPSGELQTVSESGELIIIARFEAGREVIERAKRYENGRLKTREAWLGGVQQPDEPDDPWRLRLARFVATGDELRNGLREAWWPNGQPKLRVEYRLGKAVGQARWWHENGQLALSGVYEDGLACGQWNWWRESGLRAASCRYDQGAPVGEWSLWAADGQRQPAGPTLGKVVQRPGMLLVR
jgi:antitoxin component YwqK of YwqJK toxin-antitoxin module